jgi:hypothetical protein
MATGNREVEWSWQLAASRRRTDRVGAGRRHLPGGTVAALGVTVDMTRLA